MRVYEYAKKIGSSSKEILKHLSSAGFDVDSHMALLSDEEVEFLNQKYVKREKKGRAPGGSAYKKNPDDELYDEDFGDELSPQELTLEAMTVADFSERLHKQSNEVILTLLKWGIVAPKNMLLDENIISRLAQHFQVIVKKPERALEKRVEAQISTSHAQMQQRLPVVVVLGHVDHGKTTLLDFIRKTRVAAREKGGITQHLGAYHANTKHGGIVFLDTPGHEAFSKIRARGLKVADIAVLVVAADDGIMLQTIEAIRFAKELQVPVIVAVNKIDKADPSRIDVVKRQLAEQDLLPEEWGGQTVVVPISAKLGTGIDSLLEMIDLQAQLLELKADISGAAKGYVLESKMEKGRGSVATVLLQQGNLKIGDYFISGHSTGRVSSLLNSYSQNLKEVGPSYPVQVSGFDSLPSAGDFFEVVAKDKLRKPQTHVRSVPKVASKAKSINLIIKTDTDSSKEALEDSIKKLAKKFDFVDFNIIASGVGDVNEGDVILASHTGASVIGLHVKATNATSAAQRYGVSIVLFDIIYKLLEELEQRAERVREVKRIDKKIGEGVVRKIFDIKKVGIIAGCYVKEGIFSRQGKMVVWRNKHKVGEGSIISLQREGKNVKDVHAGFECAFMVSGLDDFAVDDRVECYISVPESSR